MSDKRRGLGRGLDALLGAEAGEATAPASTSESDALRELPVDRIRPGSYQPRKDMDEDKLRELAESIRAQGVVQPIVVRPAGGGEHEIIAGERRWRAAQIAGLDAIPAVVREVADQVVVAMALIENIQREDLNPLEEAGALQRLIQEFGLTHQQVAEAVGRSRVAVSNLLRLRELSEEVKSLVAAGDLEMGHARALLALSGDQQARAAREVVRKGLSVRATEQLVRRMQQAEAERREGGEQPDPDIQRLQDDLAERLCAKVQVQHRASGKGRLVIQYNSLDELDGILDHIK